MTQQRSRQALLIAGLSAVAVLIAFMPGVSYLTALGLDFTWPVATAVFSRQAPYEPSPIVFVAIDERTHNTAPFSETPEVAWTPYLAQVVDFVDGAGATVMGFDVIYPKTLATPELLPGFDRPFLRALYGAGREGRLVLGETRLSGETISPYEGQILAVGGRKNLSPLQLTPDADGVVRRYPASIPLEDGGQVASFAAELWARTGGTPPQDSFLINFNPGTQPAMLGLSDVLACLQSGAPDFAGIFKDRIVIFGTALDVEDRHLAASRFAAGNAPKRQNLSCVGDAPVLEKNIHRQTVSGAYIHALALQTLIEDSAPQPLSAPVHAALIFILTVILYGLFLRLPPLYGLGILGVALAAYWGVASAALGRGVVLPYLYWSAAALFSYMLLFAYRAFFEDQEKRWIRHAFRHYLSPALVDQLSEAPDLLRLGGEKRRVAVMFLDLSGFTAVSERLADKPQDIVSLLNIYFSRFSDIIEQHGGYVDKFMGDGIMAVWGAPVLIDAPEKSATRAAIACREAAVELQKEDASYAMSVRIGLSVGDVLAGNMGSQRRFNYTVIGDSVNLAARLESANKFYGTTILAAQDIAKNLNADFVTRKIDFVKVAGKAQPVTVYEVLGDAENLESQDIFMARQFERALEAYRRRHFKTAAQEFDKLAPNDPVARLYAQRTRNFLAHPPPAQWDGVEEIVTK